MIEYYTDTWGVNIIINRKMTIPREMDRIDFDNLTLLLKYSIITKQFGQKGENIWGNIAYNSHDFYLSTLNFLTKHAK